MRAGLVLMLCLPLSAAMRGAGFVSATASRRSLFAPSRSASAVAAGPRAARLSLSALPDDEAAARRSREFRAVRVV